MPELIITGTPVAFPADAASPDWAPAVVQFAELVTTALGSVVGSFDVVPQQFIIDAIPNGTPTAITNLAFSTATVNGSFIRYTVFRNSSTTTLSESGNLMITYNPTNSPGSLWEMTRDYVGEADVTFTISDTGQISVTPTAISGTGYNGYISFSANALQVTY